MAATWETSYLTELCLECVRTLSNGKTPGPDGMINEIIKLLPTAALECIHSLFIIMWATGMGGACMHGRRERRGQRVDRSHEGEAT